MDLGAIGGFVKNAFDCVPPQIKEKALDIVKDVATDLGEQLLHAVGEQMEQIGLNLQGADLDKLFGSRFIQTAIDLLPGPMDFMDFGMLSGLDLSQFQPICPHIPDFNFGPDVNVNVDVNINLDDLMGQMQEMASEMMGLSEIKDMLMDLLQQLAAAQGGGQSTTVTPAGAEPPSTAPTTSAGGTNQTDSTQQAGGANGASGAEGTNGAQGSEKTENTPSDPIIFNGKELEALKRTDPEAFAARLQSMSPEDRNAAMMELQTHLQEINQMFSMMSNFAKVEHDTMKAIIGNMRV